MDGINVQDEFAYFFYDVVILIKMQLRTRLYLCS
jgi:hypothetical protein